MAQYMIIIILFVQNFQYVFPRIIFGSIILSYNRLREKFALRAHEFSIIFSLHLFAVTWDSCMWIVLWTLWLHVCNEAAWCWTAGTRRFRILLKSLPCVWNFKWHQINEVYENIDLINVNACFCVFNYVFHSLDVYLLIMSRKIFYYCNT